MKITRIDVFGYDLHYAHGSYVMSGGRSVTALPSTVVRLQTDEGLTGWGEVCPLGATYLAGHAGGARAALREMAPALMGADPCNLALVNDRMDAALLGHGYAKSPVDMACWDLFGKATGRPVAALLGGRRQAAYPLYIAVPLGAAEEMAAYVQAKRASGIHRFQSGPYYTITGNTSTGVRRADYLGGPVLMPDGKRTVNQYLNPAAFAPGDLIRTRVVGARGYDLVAAPAGSPF